MNSVELKGRHTVKCYVVAIISAQVLSSFLHVYIDLGISGSADHLTLLRLLYGVDCLSHLSLGEFDDHFMSLLPLAAHLHETFAVK